MRYTQQRATGGGSGPYPEHMTLQALQLVTMLEAEELRSTDWVEQYVARIEALDASGPRLGAVLEVNPEAGEIAEVLDRERAAGHIRGPLHGIPVLVKDNIDTADSMHTSAGSLALMQSQPPQDATVVQQLRAAGAIILGKTNMSEWASFRASPSTSGWSGRGHTRNPHSLLRSASGSSSGSAAAVAAGFAPISVGTETSGSIVSPASACGVVGLKPTVGLTSRAGVIPISHSQDSVGLFAKSVMDVALALGAMTGIDPRDQATLESDGHFSHDYLAPLDAHALRGARLGVITNFDMIGYSPYADTIFESAITVMEALGAEVVRDIQLPSAEQLREKPGSYERMLYEFRHDINAYLQERGDASFTSLNDLIAFNEQHAEEELHFIGQERFLLAEATRDVDPAAMQALDTRLKRLSREEGIDAVLQEHQLDAIIAPTAAPAGVIDVINGEPYLGSACELSAIAGYPIISVPAGRAHGMPVGLSFTGRAWSEQHLLNLAYAFEQATRLYRQPSFYEGDIVLSGLHPRLELPKIMID